MTHHFTHFRNNSTFYSLILSIILSINIALFIIFTISSESVQISHLTQSYALLSLLFLYLTLLAEPFCHIFKAIPFRDKYLRTKPAFLTATFYFGLLHASNAFFRQLGGFEGIGFLSSTYLLAISLGFLTIILLTILTFRSITKVAITFTFLQSKKLSLLLHLVGILILIHAVMLGTHFQNLYEFIPQILFSALAFLFFLELLRFDEYLKKKFPHTIAVHPGTIPLYALLMLGILYFLIPLPATDTASFGIHAEHIRLAKEAQQRNFPSTSSNLQSQSSNPGLVGDRSKRYTVSFDRPPKVSPNEDVNLTFTVYDASSGQEVKLFNRLYEKIVHMIVVDETLSYFTHIHPDQNGSSFTITTSFPDDGQYHIYLDFQPFSAIEQQMAFTLAVGNSTQTQESTQPIDINLSRTFGEYKATLAHPQPLKASAMSLGQQELSFTISDAQTNKPITTLKPYLAAFGHLVLINQKTFDYVHVHPSALRPPRPNENGGPTIKFLPLGIYGPIKPGTYRVFAQFNPNNELFTSDFTVEVK